MIDLMSVRLPSAGSTTAFLLIVLIVCACVVAAHALSATGQGITTRRNALLFICVWLAVTAMLPLAKFAGSSAATIQGAAFVLILVVVAVVSMTRYGRRIAMGVPVVFLVGLHSIRLPLELILHQWWQEGFLPVQMTYSGDNFDIITGALAIAVALFSWRFKAALWPVWLFNIVGFVLLLRILVIVNLSNPTPLKAAFGGYAQGQEVLVGLFFPYVWLATVIVAGALFFHIVLFRRLFAARSATPR